MVRSILRNIRLATAMLAAIFYLGCAAHPSVADHTLEKGEKYAGYTLSTENVFPILFQCFSYHFIMLFLSFSNDFPIIF